MPRFEDYPEDSIASSDKVLFYKIASTAVKSITFTNLATAIRSAISSFFTSSTVVPSAPPAAGRILVGNAGGTAYAPVAVSGDAGLSSTGALTIGQDAVTFAKMQNISAASRLVGRGSAAGAGDAEEITLGTGLSMSGTTLNVSAGTGNVVQASDATAADRVFVSGGTDKSRVETPVEIDPGTGDVSGIGELSVASVITPEIAVSVTHAADDTYHGITVQDANAGGVIAQWEIVYMDNTGEWQLADANGTGTYPARAIAVEAGTAGNPMTVLIVGTVRNDAWNWTPGGDLFMSATAGGITQSAPAVSGDEVQKVGFALTADIAFFNFASGETATVT